MFCSKCGNEITDDKQMFCDKCGNTIKSRIVQNSDISLSDMGKSENNSPIDAITSKISSLAGGEGKVDLHLKDLVVDVFKHHTSDEAENIFICGTTSTTPIEEEIVSEWARPWLYSRVLAVLLISFFILVQIFLQFNNPYALPNILFIGSLAMPISVVVLFFEMNVPRNISFPSVIKVFFLGGALSLMVTLALFAISPESDNSYLSALVTGIVEEIGKAIIVGYFISKHKGKLYLLNGILIGSVVGAGFAVFESAGYALYWGIKDMLSFEVVSLNQFYQGMIYVVKMRAFLSPGGHVAWAAVSGFAIVLAMGGKKYSWDVFANVKFLRIFWIPIALHAIWDCPLKVLSSNTLKYYILIVIIWIVLLVFINRGFEQISKLSRKSS